MAEKLLRGKLWSYCKDRMIKKKYSLSHNLKLADALIGATALTYDLPLYTYNTRDFKFIPKIVLWDSSTS
jgi:predicted nucleic acid-binding protein